MKTAIISFILFTICYVAFGQANQQDTVILLKAFREVTKAQQIVYVDTVNNYGFGSEQLTTSIKKGKIKDIGKSDKPNSLSLTKPEQKYLLEQVATKTVWADHLFSDGKRINSDSMWVYLKQENAKRISAINKAAINKDTLTLKNIKSRYSFVFTFTKPIYIRDNTICLISFSAMCGPECGRDEISFYKKENNEWKKWLIVSAGDF